MNSGIQEPYASTHNYCSPKFRIKQRDYFVGFDRINESLFSKNDSEWDLVDTGDCYAIKIKSKKTLVIIYVKRKDKKKKLKKYLLEVENRTRYRCLIKYLQVDTPLE